MNQSFYPFKRSCIHNVSVESSLISPKDGLREGLVLPREWMKLGDIAPYERVIVTRLGGDNWKNRMYTWAIPGNEVEARGSIGHLLAKGDECCIISGTYLNQEQYDSYCPGKLPIPAIDIRFNPDRGIGYNDISLAKKVLEYNPDVQQFQCTEKDILEQRTKLPRIMLSNLVTGLGVSAIERRCMEMNAELPVDIMKQAGMVRNQTIFVYNARRGGISAPSYVVPNARDKNIVISGALSGVAGVGDEISEAAFVITYGIRTPIIFDVKTGTRYLVT
jgi:aspartate 1-decarboxylase